MFAGPGTDVMILKIFLPKNFAKKLAFFIQNKAKLCKHTHYSTKISMSGSLRNGGSRN
jgi:hypothetical protein